MITINIQKRHLFFISAIVVFFVGIGIVISSWPSPDPAVWHDSDSIKIKIMDEYKSLQEAIDDGDFISPRNNFNLSGKVVLGLNETNSSNPSSNLIMAVKYYYLGYGNTGTFNSQCWFQLSSSTASSSWLSSGLEDCAKTSVSHVNAAGTILLKWENAGVGGPGPWGPGSATKIKVYVLVPVGGEVYASDILPEAVSI